MPTSPIPQDNSFAEGVFTDVDNESFRVQPPVRLTPRVNRTAAFLRERRLLDEMLNRRTFDPAPLPTPDEIRSEDAGDFIKSKRTFGIEYEINFSWNDAAALRDIIGQSYKIVHDGSVRNGLEIVSPILAGKAGEEEVIKVCKAINDAGGRTDETCGLHIHFGAKDFYKKNNVQVWTLEHALKFYSENTNHTHSYFILHNTAIEYLKKDHPEAVRSILKSRPIGFYEWEKLFIDFNKLQTSYVMLSGNRTLHDDFYVKNDHKNESKIKRQGTVDTKAEKICYSNYFQSFIVNPKNDKKLRVIVCKKNTNDQKTLERLKRLAAFYVVFDDVIMSMLPQDRRENDYTRRVGHRMAIEDIMNARTTVEFFMNWFKFTDSNQVTNVNGNGGNGRVRGRYCGLNLYSVLNIQTIEIRYLGGSIDPAHILHWANLHQTIIDLAADTENYRGSTKSLLRAALIVDQEKRRQLFFKKLNLPSETERYWKDQIENHRNDDDVLLQECIEEDNKVLEVLKDYLIDPNE